MYKHLLMFALLLTTLAGIAQNKATIKGKIIDSATNMPVEFVTVAVLTVKDTTSLLLSYTITDKSGAFALHSVPLGIPLKIFISNVAYRPYRKFITLNKAEIMDLHNILLSTNQLNEIVVKGERPPIVINKDTIEFNAEAFKTRPNAVIEDLLKKLPGVEVDMDGKIVVNGKEVNKILVDGHEFFNSDYRIATKNLDVDLIDKVQVYDDRENDPDHIIPESKVGKIINLKFKKALRKSMFGKIYAGAGTEDRYTAGGLFNLFRDTLQISVLGQGNNLNSTSFSYDDLSRQGGFNRGGGDTFYRGGLSPGGGFGGIGFIGFGGLGNTGIQKVISSGVNVNTDYGKKLKINLAYYYSHTHTDNNSINNKQQMLADTNVITNSINSSFNAGNAHNLSATVRWQPNDATQLTYNPTLIRTDNQSGNGSTVNSFSNFIPQIAFTTNSGNNSSNSTQFQQNLTYHHQFKNKGESIDISHSLQINPNDGIGYTINNLTSYTAQLQSFLLNRNNNTLNRNTDAKLGVTYRYPFSKKLTGSFGIADDYNHQVNNTITYDFDAATGQYDSFLQTLSSNLTRNLWTENVTTGLTYNFKPGIQAVVTANTQILQVNNKFDRGFADINQHFLTVLPNVDFNLGNYSLSYQSGFTLPYIGDMIPYTVVSSPLYAVTGNPDLKPTRRDNYSFRYNKYNMKSQMFLNAGISLSEEQNSVFRHQTLDAVGATTSTPINMDGRYTFSTNLSISKSFKKTNDFQLRISTNVSASKSHGYFEINSQGGYQSTYYGFFVQQLTLNWKDFISFDQSYTLNSSITTYTGVNYNNVANITHTLNSHLIITGPKKVNLEGTYTFKYDPMVSPGFQKASNMVNLSLARELLKKDRGEIKISCYDILNQNISSFRYINANTITDTQAEVLRRYFMLTLQFKFNKTITK